MFDRIYLPVTGLLIIVCFLFSCTHESMEDISAQPSRYPEEVARIMETRCATAGCHNKASFVNAGGLLLDTWEHMFDGGNNGSVIVPYSPDYSSLLYFINTHADQGPIAVPTMPLNDSPLSLDEYLTIRNWVASGAPDVDGNISFSSEGATRQKIYMAMQGCDVIAVVDAASRVVMRYIPVGKSTAIEQPHCVRVSKDGKYAYVSFLAGEYVQKIDATTDELLPEAAHVGIGQWNVIHPSEDGTQLMITDWSNTGKVIMINTADMSVQPQFGGDFKKPHGVTSNAGFNTFYVTSELENFIYKFSFQQAYFKKVPIDEGNAPPRVIHEIIMLPGDTRYMVTCQETDEVRVMDAIADTLIKVIPVGIQPQELAISTTKPYVFVTCIQDNSSWPGYVGSVYVINYNTYEVTKVEGPMYQPHGIAVDDINGTFYVVSRNASESGPPPHHTSSCQGRNGYYHVYDLNTLQRLPKRYEVSVDPYSADVRFK